MEKLCNMLNLSGKTAIVTGGSSGIGFGISYRLAEAGANVVIANRTKEEGIRAAKEITKNGWKAMAIVTDVSIEESVKNMVNRTVEAYGEVDILVNNAGVYPLVPVREMSLADFEKVIAINLKGTFLCTKYVSERMVERRKGGRIINITSIDALHPSSVGLAHYDASKHGVWGFTKNIALELAPYNVWVNAVAPGGIMTPGVQKLQQTTPIPSGEEVEKVLKGMAQRIPMQRLGEPDDIGKVVVFLASDMASYMTGSQIVVDGGLLLM
jgi:2-deoxy-D-gluconate 3-dehydrogenase